VPESEKRLYALAEDTTIVRSTEAQRLVAALDTDAASDRAARLADLNRYREHFTT
jgi:hypothetical protein